MIASEVKKSTSPWHDVLARVNTRLLIIVVLAAAARIAWLVAPMNSSRFSTEEFEYLRLAQNIVNGNSYIGLYGNLQTVHLPLYPAAVAFLEFLLGDIFLSGIIVSVVAGTLLPIPLYYLARKCYGAGAATLAAILAALFPYLIWISTQTYSESLFLTLMATALLFGVLTFDFKNATIPVMAGVAFGLAYLARPTALYLMAPTMLFLIGIGFIHRVPVKKIVLHAVLVIIPFLIFIAPYIGFLYNVTGHVLLDGKSAGLRSDSLAIYAGVNKDEANRGIDEDLNQKGFDLDQTAFTIKLLQGEGESAAFGPWLRGTLLHLPQNSLPIARFLLNVTSPLILLMSLVGVFRLLEAGPARWSRLYIFLAFGLLLIIQVALPWFLPRYAAPLIVFILYFSAVGLDWLSDFITRQLRSRFPKAHQINRSLVVGLATAILLVSTVPSIRALRNFDNPKCYDVSKDAGLWLQQQGASSPRVMDLSLGTTFFSGGTALIPPYTDEATAIRYIAKHDPTYIAAFEQDCKRSPYMCGWLEDGIPDNRAKLVYEDDSLAGCRIKLYEWSD